MTQASRTIGVVLATIVLICVGAGIGVVFASLILGVSRNPSLRGQLFSYSILDFDFFEAIGLFALILLPFLLIVVLGFRYRGKINRSKLASGVRSVFSVKNLLSLLVCAIFGWSIRTYLMFKFDLDLEILHNFLCAMVPAGILTCIVRVIITNVELESLTLGGGTAYCSKTYSLKYDPISGNGSGSGGASASGGGSGGASGSGGGSGNGSVPDAAEISRQREITRQTMMRNLQEQHQRFMRAGTARQQSHLYGARFVATHNPMQPRLIQEAQITDNAIPTAERIQEAQARQAAETRERVAHRTLENRQNLASLASSNNPSVTIPDPANLGVRGYIHNGINQPYASAIALYLENGNLAGTSSRPDMDGPANRFLAAALPHLRPEVYGQNPTVSGENSMITKKLIKQLRKMP